MTILLAERMVSPCGDVAVFVAEYVPRRAFDCATCAASWTRFIGGEQGEDERRQLAADTFLEAAHLAFRFRDEWRREVLRDWPNAATG